MGTQHNLPLAGIWLALVTFVAMLLLDFDPIVATSVVVVWIGSLLLASGRPPEPPPVIVEQELSIETIGSLIENSSTPFLVTDKNTIAVANNTARRMLGQHIVGQDSRVTFRQPEASALLSEARNGQAIVRGLVRRQDIWQINRQGVSGELAVIELINLTTEADVSRAHTDFVANASHELRTPLAAILGYVETLNEGNESLDSPTSRKFLGTIEREGRRLQSLIGDLMSLSRVEAEKHDLPQDVLDLAELTERAARDAAGSDRVERLELDLLAQPWVKGDRQQLEQVVRNLVDNALKYGSPDTDVTVKLDLVRDDMARISVTDQGDGISPEHIPHLTRRFYRTDPGRSRASGGTGLGLAIVKHIVERHRGRLDITSDVGKGTQVVVRIPIVEDESRDEEEPRTNRPSRQSGSASEEETPPLS